MEHQDRIAEATNDIVQIILKYRLTLQDISEIITNVVNTINPILKK